MVFITPPSTPQSEDSTNEVHSAHAVPPAASEPTFLGLGDTLVEISDNQTPTLSQAQQGQDEQTVATEEVEQEVTEYVAPEPEVARFVLPRGAAVWITGVSLSLTIGLALYAATTGSSTKESAQSANEQVSELPSEPTLEPVADPPSDLDGTTPVSVETIVEAEAEAPVLSEEDFTLPEPPANSANEELKEQEIAPAANQVVDPIEIEQPELATDYINAPTSSDPLDYDPTAFDMALIDSAEASAPSETVSHTTNRPVSEAETIAMLPRENVRKQATKLTILERYPSKLSAEENLANPLPEVDLKQIPLSDAMGLFTNLTGTPVSTSPAALRYAAIDANQKIDIQGVGIPVADILNEALAPARLSLSIEGQHGLVVRDGVESESTVTHKLDDLLKRDEQASLTDDHRKLIQAYSDKPIKLDGEGNLPLTQPKRQQFDLLILAERIRLARGLPTTSKYPKRLLSIEPLYAQLAPILERQTTFNFVSATRFGALIDHLSQATGLTVLVDWPTLADVGLSPNTTMTALADNCTWNEAMDGLLGALQLGWSPIDGKTVWISSKSADKVRLFTEFYPGMPKLKADSLAESYADVIVVYDKPSRTTIVHGNSTTQRAAYQLWLSQ